MNIGEEIDKILKADKVMIHVNVGIGPPGFFDITRSVVLTWGHHCGLSFGLPVFDVRTAH